MPIPETTSAEALELYVGGKCLAAGRGEAWRDVRASLFRLPTAIGQVHVPAVSEPVLIWITSGEIEVEERETDGPWIKSLIKKHSFFLTTAGAPYDCKWRALTAEPFEFMMVLIALPVIQKALEEVYGSDSARAQLGDFSGFTDPTLDFLLAQLHGELLRGKASSIFVQSNAQMISVHLARNYAVKLKKTSSVSPSLPGYKLRQITDWMSNHIAEDFDLTQLADRAGLSKFHFHRLFKSAVGISPAHYHLNLRLEKAKRLLRETEKSIITIALEVGYTNPSHFAQLFRRETGLPPSDYRRKR